MSNLEENQSNLTSASQTTPPTVENKQESAAETVGDKPVKGFKSRENQQQAKTNASVGTAAAIVCVACIAPMLTVAMPAMAMGALGSVAALSGLALLKSGQGLADNAKRGVAGDQAGKQAQSDDLSKVAEKEPQAKSQAQEAMKSQDNPNQSLTQSPPSQQPGTGMGR